MNGYLVIRNNMAYGLYDYQNALKIVTFYDYSDMEIHYVENAKRIIVDKSDINEYYFEFETSEKIKYKKLQKDITRGEIDSIKQLDCPIERIEYKSVRGERPKSHSNVRVRLGSWSRLKNEIRDNDIPMEYKQCLTGKNRYTHEVFEEKVSKRSSGWKENRKHQWKENKNERTES